MTNYLIKKMWKLAFMTYFRQQALVSSYQAHNSETSNIIKLNHEEFGQQKSSSNFFNSETTNIV